MIALNPIRSLQLGNRDAGPARGGFRTYDGRTMTDAVSRATILVVDDEAPLLRLISRVLEKQGHHTLTASDGTEAI